jgi:hypothetical protein
MTINKQNWAEWSTRRPVEAGFVFLGETYLPFDVAMWHQVHCLNHIRSIILHRDDGSDHTVHCFHYLRQGILCNADSTLEPWPKESFDVDGKEIFPGNRVTHTCKDFEYIYEWTTKQHEGWSKEQNERYEMFGTMKHSHGQHGGGNDHM